MSIANGAFGQSAQGAFIKSAQGARGYGGEEEFTDWLYIRHEQTDTLERVDLHVNGNQLSKYAPGDTLTITRPGGSVVLPWVSEAYAPGSGSVCDKSWTSRTWIRFQSAFAGGSCPMADATKIELEIGGEAAGSADLAASYYDEDWCAFYPSPYYSVNYHCIAE